MYMFDKPYNYKDTEQKWQKYWSDNQIHKWDASEIREETFVIDTPPPTISGSLHMGHIYSYAQADFVARFQRMNGKTVFYPIGFDDNGLPTERLVEKERKIKASQIDRAQFIAICKEVVQSYEKEFRALFQSVAFSFDWSQEYQTISDNTIKLSQMSFMDLYRKNLLYRRNAPTFWDPIDQTAIAQAEIEDKEQTGLMSEIIFKIKDGEELVIATTRPEMLPACVAVFYHPDDQRYAYLQNKSAIVPVFRQLVPILPDDEVEIEKGTGLVMCCTFGDIQDIRWWQKHNLEIRQCINKYGQMQNADTLDGLKVKAAREKILELLQEQKLIINQKEVVQAVKCAERSGAPLEIISTYQWYISVVDKKELLLDQSAKCNWHPAYMKVRLDNWIKGLNQDWCISRQRFFGVPFPVWYSKRSGEEGKIILADISQLPADPTQTLPHGYEAHEVIPDYDVMDTWATSSLTPQLSSHGINEEFAIDYERHSKLFPADLRPQAHEIIRTWAFSTIVKALYHENTIPWRNLMISGWCLSHDKTKMSKSKGNIVTPQKLLEEKSADVVRYWASNSKLGADIVYSEDAFKIGHRLVNKIWNVAKFCSLHLSKYQYSGGNTNDDIKNCIITEPTDLWIISKLQLLIAAATASFAQFEYCEARVAIEEFFWKSYCDNYIELAKHRIYNNDNSGGQQSGIATIYHTLNALLRLFAPFMPHVTEEIYQSLFSGARVSVHERGAWPKASHYVLDNDALLLGDAAVALLELVRKNKTLMNISIAKEVEEVQVATNSLINLQYLHDLQKASNAKIISVTDWNLMPKESLLSECKLYAVSVI